jgi:hypothetical protein
MYGKTPDAPNLKQKAYNRYSVAPPFIVADRTRHHVTVLYIEAVAKLQFSTANIPWKCFGSL